MSGRVTTLHRGRILIALLAAALTVAPGFALAQFMPPAAGSPTPAIDQRWPNPDQQLQQQQQQQQQQPRPQAEPNAMQTPPAPRPKPTATAKLTPRAAAPLYALSCDGVFAKDTTHLKLAVKYDSRNLAYTDVDGPDRTKIKATVLFPRDPKRRLEVVWNNDTARSDIQVISINGESHWTAPKGLKLGLTLADLEKLNRRPFRLTAFGPEGNAAVVDWQGGALAALPGGCKVGVRLAAAPNSVTARGSMELLSNDATLRQVKANIAEILLGY